VNIQNAQAHIYTPNKLCRNGHWYRKKYESEEQNPNKWQ
jgi:hypothetical protein